MSCHLVSLANQRTYIGIPWNKRNQASDQLGLVVVSLIKYRFDVRAMWIHCENENENEKEGTVP